MERGLSVCLSVCLSVLVITVSLAKNGWKDRDGVGEGQTRMGPRNYVLDGNTHRRHLANTFERSVLGGDAGYRYTITAHVSTRRTLSKDRSFK